MKIEIIVPDHLPARLRRVLPLIGLLASSLAFAAADTTWIVKGAELTADQLKSTLDSIAGGMVPTGTVQAFAGVVDATHPAPNGWVLCNGTLLDGANAQNAPLFGVIGQTYIKPGGGAGGTKFNVPDLRGRVIAGVDGMGGTTAAGVLTTVGGMNGTALAATGGSETATLTSPDQLPAHGHAGSFAPATHTHPSKDLATHLRMSASAGLVMEFVNTPTWIDTHTANADTNPTWSAPTDTGPNGSGMGIAVTGNTDKPEEAGAGVSSTGKSAPFSQLQPTIVLNYIIKL